MKRLLVLGTLIVILGIVIIYSAGLFNKPGDQIVATLVSAVEVPTGFTRADGTILLSFPDDFGPHPNYQTEWWYYTGNLKSADGRHFGYQLTFFRRALQPLEDHQDRESSWASDQIYMAHLSLSDIAGEKHHAFERFSRGAAGLAGAQAEPFMVWLEDWQVKQTDVDQYHLKAQWEGIEIDLELSDVKGPVLHGDGGYSQKGPDAGDASYYYSQPRLVTKGVVRIVEQQFPVEGLSWMDHEFSTRALSQGQVGWDWFSVHLDEGSELMVFQIRRDDGSIDDYSRGTLINQDGSTQPLKVDDFEILIEDTWQSPKSRAVYPAQWTLRVPEYDLSLSLEPFLADQEMDVSYAYWEGAVRVKGMYKGLEVTGSGYIEMTGYAASMEGEF